MKLGVFGVRADNRGLAYQTQAFVKWLNPLRVFGLDLTADDMSPYPCDWSPFEDEDITIRTFKSFTEEDVRTWLRGLDVVVGAETFYRYEFPVWAKEEGVRTILQINPEFAPWFNKGKNLPRPDVLVNPTIWMSDRLPGVHHLPLPVDRQRFPFRQRIQARRFVHVAGHKAMADRAGTQMLLTGLQNLSQKADITLVVRSQSKLHFHSPAFQRQNVILETLTNFPDPTQLYVDADIVIHARRYGGNSLVINEALSMGCPVIVLDRDPERNWGGTIPTSCYKQRPIRTQGGFIDTFSAFRGALPAMMNKLYYDPEWVAEESQAANEYAESISWERMLPVYMDVLRAIKEGNDVADVLRRFAATFRGPSGSDLESTP